jgi:MFS family permease
MASRSFRGLWFATGSANLADGMTLFVLPLLALSIGTTAGGVAAVAAVATLAWPVFGLHAGWIVDRSDRRRLLLGANATRAAAVGVLAVAVATDEVSLAMILVVAAVYGIAETLVDTALTSTVPALVEPGDRTRANARIETTINFTNSFVGPPLAGLLIGVGMVWALGGGALLYAAAIGGVLLVRLRHRAPAGTATTPADTRVRAGLVTLWRHPLLRSVTLVTAGMNCVWAAWVGVFVVHAVDPGPLGLSAAAYGLVLTAMAVGGLLASATVDRLRRRVGVRALLVVDCVGTVLLVAPAALGLGVWPTVAGLVAAGAGASIWRVLIATIRQNVTPEHLLGRVYAASRVISWGTIPLGSALAGLLAELTTVRTVFVAATALAVVVLGSFVVVMRRHDLEAPFTEQAAVPTTV